MATYLCETEPSRGRYEVFKMKINWKIRCLVQSYLRKNLILTLTSDLSDSALFLKKALCSAVLPSFVRKSTIAPPFTNEINILAGFCFKLEANVSGVSVMEMVHVVKGMSNHELSSKWYKPYQELSGIRLIMSFWKIGQSQPLFVYFHLFYISQFKPGAAGWKVQSNWAKAAPLALSWV